MKLSQALRINPGDVVAFVGGGGKTTAMFRLANELAPILRVLTTTTTHISVSQVKHSPVYVVFDPREQRLADIFPQLDAAIAVYGQVLLIGGMDATSDRVVGMTPEIVAELAVSGHFDVIIVEADGSRALPFKAPAEHEPVIPDCATLVVPVVGLDVLGRPLTDEYVHRANLIGQLSGAEWGRPVTVETIVAVLCHPAGGLKSIPTQARVTPLLNKVDGSEEGLNCWSDGQWGKIGGLENGENKVEVLNVAHELASALLCCERVDMVMIGSVRDVATPVVEVYSRAAVVILAAGGSTRFGSPKQLAHWGDKTFIEHSVDVALASPARLVIVVLGAEVERCRTLLADQPVLLIINEHWAEGQSTSLRAGLAALPANIGCALFLPVDLPGVTAEIITQLIQRHRQTLAPVVWPEFAGRRGNPVLFDRRLFFELQQIRGDIGGKPVLLAYQDQAERVSVAEVGVLQDFDRPEDLAGIKGR